MTTGLFAMLARPAERKSTDISALTWTRLFGEPSSKSGVSVNLDSALRTSTVLACTRVHAEGVAQLPAKIYRESADGVKTPAVDHSVYDLLARRPNDWMTSFDFRETMMYHAVLTGNAYAQIGRIGNRIVELIPLVRAAVTPTQDAVGNIFYDVTNADGLSMRLPRRSVFHLRGPSWDGVAGLDMVRLAREAIGLAIASEQSHASLHANGARPGGILSIDGSLGPEAREQLKASWTEFHSGLGNAGKTAVLDNGAKFQSMTMTGLDAQHIELRRLQIEEICRALRVMPVMLNHPADIAARAAMEQLFIAHVVHYLMPWVRRWEETVERDLLDDERDLRCKFTVAGLMRGALKDQGEYFAKALGSGGSPAWLTQNEVRGFLEMNPQPGGDDLPRPTNPGVPAGDGDDGGDDDEGDGDESP
jgi:HK97 family phage portal protein